MNGEELRFLEKRFNEFDKKLDKVHDTVLKLPCGVHEEKLKGLGKSVDRAWLWIYGIVIGSILTGILILTVRSVMAQ